MFLWFNFWNILNVCILNTNSWIGIIKFGGHHASKFGIIYSNGGHIGFNYNHTSLSSEWNFILDCISQELNKQIELFLQVSQWAHQRESKLSEALSEIRQNQSLIDQLMAWLTGAEASLIAQDHQPIPDNLPIIEQLLHDHQTFEQDIQVSVFVFYKVCSNFHNVMELKYRFLIYIS